MSARTHQRYDLITGRLQKTANTPTAQYGVMRFVVDFQEKNGLYITHIFSPIVHRPYVSNSECGTICRITRRSDGTNIIALRNVF